MDKRKLILDIYTAPRIPQALLDFSFSEEEDECFSGYVKDATLIVNKSLKWTIRYGSMTDANLERWLHENPKFLGDTEAEIIATLEREEIQCLLNR